jgi:glycosyltransferase involved in cell wall biosynthesis
VSLYIALTEFARGRFIAGGLPAAKIVVKPNFVHPDPGPRAGGDYAIFVGRLSPEKGVDTLLDAWKVIGNRVPLKIVGDGPMADLVRGAVQGNPSIEWLGRRAPEQIADLIGNAALLVQPSNCFETFGRVAVEAFAVGTPVVATGHGAMADVVGTDARLGETFAPGIGMDLATKVLKLMGDPARLAILRSNVRREYQAKYTGPQNQIFLNDIYRQAIAVSRGTAALVEQTPAAGVLPS